MEAEFAAADFAEPVAGDGVDQLAATLGQNLRRIRTRNGLSLERLAAASGVSRAMLGQIETGKSVPTIKVLWKIATALEVPFAALTSAPNPHCLIHNVTGELTAMIVAARLNVVGVADGGTDQHECAAGDHGGCG